MNLISFLLLYKMDLKLVNANKGWHCSVFPMEDFFSSYIFHFAAIFKCFSASVLFMDLFVFVLVTAAERRGWSCRTETWAKTLPCPVCGTHRGRNTTNEWVFSWMIIWMTVFDTVVHLEDWKMLKVVTFKQLSLAVILPSEEPTAATQGVHWDDFICFYF